MNDFLISIGGVSFRCYESDGSFVMENYTYRCYFPSFIDLFNHLKICILCGKVENADVEAADAAEDIIESAEAEFAFNDLDPSYHNQEMDFEHWDVVRILKL